MQLDHCFCAYIIDYLSLLR